MKIEIELERNRFDCPHHSRLKMISIGLKPKVRTAR